MPSVAHCSVYGCAVRLVLSGTGQQELISNTTPYTQIPHHTHKYHTIHTNTTPYTPYTQIPHHTHKYHTIHTNTTPYTQIPHHTHKYTQIPHHTHKYHTIHTNTTPYTQIPHHTHKYHTIHTIHTNATPYHTYCAYFASFKLIRREVCFSSFVCNKKHF